MIKESEKKYSKTLDEKTRDIKSKILKYLTKKWNVELKEKENTINLYCKDKNTNEIIFKIVMELRFSWTTSEFPYATVTIPYRKKNLLQEDIPIFYIILNKYGTELLITTKEEILNSETITKDTVYTTNEKFYELPLNCFHKGFENLIEYIEIKLELNLDSEEETFDKFLYRCDNCEVISKIKYKKGLRCPICDIVIFN